MALRKRNPQKWWSEAKFLRANGVSCAEIAEKLGLSRHTVRTVTGKDWPALAINVLAERRGPLSKNWIPNHFDEYWIPEPNSGCWIWLGPVSSLKSTGGIYGRVSVDGQKKGAHVYSFERAYGPIEDGLYVLHKCDTTLCINPEHLFTGTNLDNMKDKWAKGRSARGDSHGMRKISRLNHEKAAAIRVDPRSYLVVAAEYGIAPRTVYSIRNGDTWGEK